MTHETEQFDHLSRRLAQTTARFPDKEAVVFGERRLTWREFTSFVDRLAAALIAWGIQPGDCVGIFCTTRPEYLITYMATMRVGAVLAGFNAQYTAGEIERLAGIVRPRLMVVLAGLVDEPSFASLVPSLPFVERFITIGESALPGAVRFEDVLAQERPGLDDALRARAATFSPGDGALIVFTGGTTGIPKAALLTHANIVSNIAAQNHYLDFRTADRLVLHLPLNHVSGATLIAAGAILSGATLVMLERFSPAETLQVVARERCTVLGQVPTMFILQFLLPDFSDYDLSSLRLVIVSGAPTPPPVMAQIASLAPLAVHGYGLTETSGMVTYTRPDDGLARLLNSAGRVVPEFEIRIVDEARRPLAAGRVGEIAVRGPGNMAGYVGNAEETSAAIDAQGWLYTGDLGRLSADGYLAIAGRRKEMYISGGYNVFPLEVETHLYGHPDVAACACLARPDSVMGEVGVVFVVARPGVTLTAAELRSYCRQGLARYKLPARIIVQDELPLTPTGKVDKQRLHARLG